MMNMIFLGLIVVAIIGLCLLIVGGNKKTKVETDNPKKKDDSLKNKHEIPKKDLFSFMEFDKISDNMIIQDKGNKYTMILKCKGINYALMSEVEQLAVEEGFINFLNTLKFPIQIYIQARSVNLKGSIVKYKERVNGVVEEYNEAKDEYSKTRENLDSTRTEIERKLEEVEKLENMVEYAQDISRYIERISLNKQLLQRNFYLVVSYYKSEITATSTFSKHEIQDICMRELYTRCQTLMSSLQTASVTSRILNSNDLAELLYISYNRDDASLIDIKTALSSGFYRLYSTSKDVFEKKEDMLLEEIQKEAMGRVEQAIQEAMNKGLIKTKDDLTEEFEHESDLEAIKIVNNSDLKDEDKDAVETIIIDKHNDGIKKRAKERENKIKEEEQVEEKKEKEDKASDSIV